MFAIHDFMSLQTYNQKVSFLLSATKDTRIDPFQPEVRLDHFNCFFLHQYFCMFDATLKRKILREFGD